MMSPIEEAVSSTGWGLYNKFLIGLAAMCYFSNGVAFMSMPLYLNFISCDIAFKESSVPVLDLSLTFGVAFGGFLFSAMADVVGRKAVITLSLITIFISVLSSSFVYAVTNFIIAQFALGAGIAANLIAIKVHMVESTPQKKRAKSIIILDVFWNLGCIVAVFVSIAFTPIVLKYRNDDIRVFTWRFLYVISGTFCIIAACLSALVLPSVRYLLYEKKTSQALNVLREIYAINNSKLCVLYSFTEADIHGKIADYGINTGPQLPDNLTSKSCSVVCRRIQKSVLIFMKKFPFFAILITAIRIFTSFGILSMNIFLTRNLMAETNCNFNGINVMHLSKDPVHQCGKITVDYHLQRDFMIFCGITIVGQIMLISIVDFVDRKYLIWLFLSGASALALAFIYGNYVVRFLISLATMVSYAFANSTLDLVVIEMFPTAVRGTAFGATMVIGLVANLCLRSYMFGPCWYAFVSLAIMLEVAALLSFALPRMKKRSMAE